MLPLLIIHACLALLALHRGWRLAPLVLTALPWLALPCEPLLSGLTLAGWMLPFANLLVAVGGFATLGLLYTAAVEPEPL